MLFYLMQNTKTKIKYKNKIKNKIENKIKNKIKNKIENKIKNKTKKNILGPAQAQHCCFDSFLFLKYIISI